MVPGSCSKVIEAVVGLLVIILWMSYATAGVETHCDGRQDGALCYGPLGGTVFIQLVDNTSETQQYVMKYTTSIILKVKKNVVIDVNPQNKYNFSPSNGTFSIKNLRTTDSGQYTLEIFDLDGRKKEARTFNLSLEAPVSSVQLVAECLSQGQVNVSCLSVGGDNPQYSWTLNGYKLTDSELLSGNIKTNTIVLKPNISGPLVCSVNTRVSSLLKEKHISKCDFMNCTSNGIHISQWMFKENNTLCDKPLADKYNFLELFLIMSGSLGALLIVLAVIMGFICAKRNKQNNKEEKKDDQKPTNDDKMRRLQELSRDTQVEYGKVNKQHRQSDVMTYGNLDYNVYGNEEDNVYANV